LAAAFNNAATCFSDDGHDHATCAESALAAAADICATKGARLTPLRRRVLELIWRSHAPVGAYDLLRALAKTQPGAAPPTVYRALEFLLARGLVHRIESLNAFVGCAHPCHTHGGQFLICDDCGAAAEVHDPRVDAAIGRRAAELGFSVSRKTVEVQGLCGPCQNRLKEAAHDA
jgi:Fur family transcriptional regulator, zinc uptake regulator